MDEDGNTNVKITGYLEKKGKMKMMNSYKRYWFVLEGRLLLYYRSKDEYEAISPCKGSINLGPPCSVKPCPSTNGVHVFQIETRTATITLRAENQEDQNRWMQGVMSALNQNMNARKLSHFRYSFDELSQYSKSAVKRKSTSITYSNSFKNPSQKDRGIIQRLQKIGAQSYGGSMGAINKKLSKHQIADNSTFNAKVNEGNRTPPADDSVEIHNRNIEIREPRNTENIYERIPNDSSILLKSKEINLSKMYVPKTFPMENGSSDLCNIENHSRPTTLLLENETYGEIQFNTRVDDTDNKIRQTSFMLENSDYQTVEEIIKYPKTSSEVIYAEPKCNDIADYNENNLVLNKMKGEENAYSISKLYDSEKSSVSSTHYEDLQKYASYTEINCKSKVKKEKNKKCLKEKNIVDDKKDLKLKKSSSFIKRVWKRKSKYKGKEENIEELYETVPETAVQKVELTDDAAVQMLSELQNILVHKKPVLLEQCLKPHKNTKPSDCSTSEHIDSAEGKAKATIEMLTELQNILHNKKISLTEPSTESQLVNPSRAEEFQHKTTDISSSTPRSEQTCPPLPTKQQNRNDYSPVHDIPNSNAPVQMALPARRRHLSNLSLEEILDELDKDESVDFQKCKLKQSTDNESAVELRRNQQSNFSREDIDCNELSRLLAELAKVTNAPILTPGVTSSLIHTNFSDEELINLLPTRRRRRHSDPDYDVPRPHKSLVNLQREESSPENVIGSTRFFGPILQPSKKNRDKCGRNSDDSPQLLSITPDSLEPELIQPPKSTLRLWDDDKNSYTSHNYYQLKQCNASNIENYSSKHLFGSTIKCLDMIQNDIYAEPKTFHTTRTFKDKIFNVNINNLHSKDVASKTSEENVDDVFIDSLEIGNNNNIFAAY